MKFFVIAMSLIGGVSFTCAAQADAGVSVGIGSAGLGLHVSAPLSPALNARFGINGWNYSFNETSSNVNYDFKMKLQTFDALLDWFPMEGAFRLTGGLAYNGTKINGVAKPNGNSTYIFNGQTYTGTDVGPVNGTITFRKVAPYLGVGWGNPVAKDKGWGMSSDVGILFQGAATAKLTATCGATVNTAPGGCATLQSNVAAEQASLNDTMKSYKYYPVLRIAATYRF
jgi:hypothetical protein